MSHTPFMNAYSEVRITGWTSGWVFLWPTFYLIKPHATKMLAETRCGIHFRWKEVQRLQERMTCGSCESSSLSSTGECSRSNTRVISLLWNESSRFPVWTTTFPARVPVTSLFFVVFLLERSSFVVTNSFFFTEEPWCSLNSPQSSKLVVLPFLEMSLWSPLYFAMCGSLLIMAFPFSCSPASPEACLVSIRVFKCFSFSFELTHFSGLSESMEDAAVHCFWLILLALCDNQSFSILRLFWHWKLHLFQGGWRLLFTEFLGSHQWLDALWKCAITDVSGTSALPIHPSFLCLWYGAPPPPVVPAHWFQGLQKGAPQALILYMGAEKHFYPTLCPANQGVCQQRVLIGPS